MDQRCKEESLVRRAQSPLLELPFPTFTHPAAVTARLRPMLAAAARMTAAGCQGAGDGASSPGNRTCYPRGIRRARGQQAPAEKEKLMGGGGATEDGCGHWLKEELPKAHLLGEELFLRFTASIESRENRYSLGTGELFQSCGAICLLSADTATLYRSPWSQR